MARANSIFNCVWLVALLAVPCWADEPSWLLRLKDGGFVDGKITPTELDGVLGWQVVAFERPFQFDLAAVRSISRVDQRPNAERTADIPSRHIFSLRDGLQVHGDLEQLDDEWLTVNSPVLGKLRIQRRHLLAMTVAANAGEPTYVGPRDDNRWFATGEPKTWQFEAASLVTRKKASLVCIDAGIADKAQLSLVLTWTGDPDFVVILGALDAKGVERMEELPAAARIEVWKGKLMLVRETDNGTDLAPLQDLPAKDDRRLELKVYLDQQQGVVTVCDAYGRQLNSLTVPSKVPVLGSHVCLYNNGLSLAVERLEVFPWDGQLAADANLDEASRQDQVFVNDGSHNLGSISSYDAKSSELVLTTDTGAATRLSLSQLRRIVFAQKPATDEATSNPPTAEPATIDLFALPTEPSSAEAAAMADGAKVDIVLSDHSRLHGTWRGARDGKLQLEVSAIEGVVQFAPDAVEALFGSKSTYEVPATNAEPAAAKPGVLKLENTELPGNLEADGAGAGAAALVWRPAGSRIASPLRAHAQGSILYRTPVANKAVTKKQAAQQRAFAELGVRQFQRVPAPPTQFKINADVNKPFTPEIRFRSGDAIDGTIERIDERGIYFQSPQTATTFASHDRVQQTAFQASAKYLDIESEKMKRLLTVPRSAKLDPPTHLLVSTSGDYLRGRLVRLEKDLATIEIRREMVDIPLAQIAQIVWLHDRKWAEGKPTTEKPPANEPADAPATEKNAFRVHTIKRGDRGLSFQPKSMAGNRLSGVSELFGECSVELMDVENLLFGSDIDQQVRAYLANPWTLSLAEYPRVFSEDAEGGSSPPKSPLVGTAAEDFGLQKLDGTRYRLSENRDRVVVLDFWASWCGPCMQTMPKIDEVVAELGTDKVHLVAINIQESATKARVAIERLEIQATTLLDVDGQVAASYKANAIPQTVIIDKKGVIKEVFVGGGPRFAEQLKAALLAELKE